MPGSSGNASVLAGRYLVASGSRACLVRTPTNLTGNTLDRIEPAMKRAMNQPTGNVCILISSGQGPAEVEEFVCLLRDYYLDRLQTTAVLESVTETQGVEPELCKSVLIECRGKGLLETLAGETGTHELVKKSTYRPQHRRKRWFAKVVVSATEPTTSTSTAVLCAADVEIRTSLAGGPGGQHVNKTATKVTARHIPTGLRVTCSQTRSQHQNKQQALRLLSQRLQEIESARTATTGHSVWREHWTLVRGNPIASYRAQRGALDRIER